jgi:acyl transferase domain-containing protein
MNGTEDHDLVNMKEQNNPSHEKPLRRLFTLSARSEHSLLHAVDDLSMYLERHDHVNLDDLSYTLTTRRSNFQWRSSTVARDVESLVKTLGAKDLARVKAPRQVTNVFVFTGQGAQWARMGYHMISARNEFSRSIYRSDQLLHGLGAQWSLVDELSRDEASSRLNDSKYGQPASTAIQLALVDFLKSWKVQAAAVIGHSSGEIAAAYAAGAITQGTAIRTSYHRSFLAETSKKRTAKPRAMIAVGLG